MNYLAHLMLAQRDQHSIIGNMMGDFRRHVNGMVLPQRVLCGIENHQRVDKFTDGHPEVRRLKGCFSRRRRRYAGIILDMAFDHFLALHWECYCTEPRETFIDYCYSCLATGMELMPARMQRTVTYMIREDWLGSYADLSGIDIALNRLARRMRFKNDLEGSVAEINCHYRHIAEGFHRFFPELIRHIHAGEYQPGATNRAIL
jgi:acyl carrier protein phosphodiesterase